MKGYQFLKQNWPFLTGFAITWYIIAKMAANFTEKDLNDSKFVEREDDAVVKDEMMMSELIVFLVPTKIGKNERWRPPHRQTKHPWSRPPSVLTNS